MLPPTICCTPCCGHYMVIVQQTTERQRHRASSGSGNPETSRLHSCYTAARSQRWACRHWTDVFQIRLLDLFFGCCFLVHSPWIEWSEILFERWLLLVTICCHISKELSKSNGVMTGIALRASPKCETYLIFWLLVGLLHVGHHRQHCSSSFSVRTCVMWLLCPLLSEEVAIMKPHCASIFPIGVLQEMVRSSRTESHPLTSILKDREPL